MTSVPVITIDGPAGVGKSTVSCLLSKRLNYHILVSGSLYRVIAWLSLIKGISANNINGLVQLTMQCQVDFRVNNETVEVYFGNRNINRFLIEESCGNRASQLAEIHEVRQSLLDYQRNFRQFPGLVADGRDMSTVVFPDADLKIFLTAAPEERALRRCRQLNYNDFGGSLREVKQQLRVRDKRDAERQVAPLVVAQDAVVIDTTNSSVDTVVEEIIALLFN